MQDRLIRETQDALLDKVSLAELNMFEVGHTAEVPEVAPSDNFLCPTS